MIQRQVDMSVGPWESYGGPWGTCDHYYHSSHHDEISFLMQQGGLARFRSEYAPSYENSFLNYLLSFTGLLWPTFEEVGWALKAQMWVFNNNNNKNKNNDLTLP